MTTALTVQRKPIQYLPQWAVSLLRLTTSKTEDGREIYYLAGNAKITESERSGLLTLLQEAEGHLVPAIKDSVAGQKQAIQALAVLFRPYLPSNVSEATVEARAKIMLEVLSDLPAHAIVEAVGLWLKGEAGAYDYNFEPKPPILRQVALKRLDRAKAQAREIRNILAAADYSPPTPVEGERERVAAGLKELSAELGNRMDEYLRKGKAERDAFSMRANKSAFEKECEDNGFPKDSPVSPSLAKLIKNQNEKIERLLE